MAKKFKSLSEVLKFHNIHYIESEFSIITAVKLNAVIHEDIVFTLNEVPYKVSEAS